MSTPRMAPCGLVTWPVGTARLSLRPATRGDLEATWSFRRLPEVNQWLTQAPVNLADYRKQFFAQDSLTKTIIIELDGLVIGDLMLDVQDGWGQAEVVDQAHAPRPNSGGYCTLSTRDTATPPRRSEVCSRWRSSISGYAGSRLHASRTTKGPGV